MTIKDCLLGLQRDAEVRHERTGEYADHERVGEIGALVRRADLLETLQAKAKALFDAWLRETMNSEHAAARMNSLFETMKDIEDL